MPPDFAWLGCHSWFSLMRGTDAPATLCAAAAARGARALAVADINGAYGALPFWEAAHEAGVAPLLAADLRTPIAAPRKGTTAGRRPLDPDGARAILIAASARGWSRLCQIITESHRGDYDAGPFPFSLRDLLLHDREGLWIVSPDRTLLGDLARESGTDRLAVAISPFLPRRDPLAFAKRAGLPAVCAPDVYFVEPESHPLHRLLRAIDLNTKLSRLPLESCAPATACMSQVEDLAAALPDCPETLAAAVRIAGECVLSEPPWGRLIFPSYEGLSSDDAFTLLKQRSFEGAVRRYGRLSRAAQQRLDRELDIIQRKGFAEYFLVVQEIVQQSPRTCGRGSAAASIVSYALGITHVDPVRHDLFFDRFLNEGRVDPPDIDVDFAWDERDSVLDYVFAKYGERRAAMVSCHIGFKGRAAVREVAKVHGLPDEEIRTVTERLGQTWQTASAEQMVRDHPLFSDVDDVLRRPPWPEILRWASLLEGRPRHLSVHCGGVVIVPDAIADHVPVEPAAKGVRVIQWEKDATEDAGLVKVDLLGNRSIAVIRDALAAVKDHYGVAIPWDRFNPLEDLRTQELVRRGDTIGVFYVESPAMRQLQVKTGKGDFEHLVIHSSIIRPAANRFIREYVRRLRGEPWRSIHPLLDELMATTHGIMVYQEDVARVAIAMAGFDAASADDLRKVLSKKHKQRKLADYRARFDAGAAARGFTMEVVEQVWEMILSFAGYSFCKPHSASYALLSFKSAYLKAHYPAEFMAAVISNQGGYYATFAYVSECRRMNLELLLPDVNESAIPWTGSNREVRVGLMQVQGLTAAAMKALIAAREKDGPFRSLDDFFRRVDLDPADARRLIRAGAFDAVSGTKTRAGLMWEWARWGEARWRGPRGRETQNATGHRVMRTLFDGDEGEKDPDASGWGNPLAPGHDAETMLRHEADALGFLVSRHPMTLYRREMAGLTHVRGADLIRHVGKNVTMVGWLVTGKVVSTREDEPMEFISFEDTTAIYETTFLPVAYGKFCHMLSYKRPYVLRGKVEEEFGAATLTVTGLSFLDRPISPSGRAAGPDDRPAPKGSRPPSGSGTRTGCSGAGR